MTAERGPSAPKDSGRPGQRLAGGLALWACRVALYATVLAAMLSAGWAEPEFGRHSDEAGHFITGTLIHDWVASGFARPPLEFARLYYTKYPKISLGHWPPLFHMVQAAWYGLAGVSRHAALALMALISGSYLLLLFECLRRRVGLLGSLVATALVLVSPVFRASCSVFMADHLVALLSFAAVWACACYLEGGRALPALGFGVLGSLAILTKQDAIALVLVLPLAVALLRRFDILLDYRFYLPLILMASVTVPVFLMSFLTTDHELLSGSWSIFAAKGLYFLEGLLLTGWSSLPIVVLGMIALAYPGLRPSKLGLLHVALVAHALGYVLIQVAATTVYPESRYKTSLLGLAALISATAFAAVSAARWAGPRARAIAATALLVPIALDHQVFEDRSFAGYRKLAESLPTRSGFQVILICSDPQGDSAIVSEFRLQRPDTPFCVLRADKILASSTWNGRGYTLFAEDPDGIAKLIEKYYVDYIMIDDWAGDSGRHSALLRSLLEAHPEQFPAVGTYPIVRRQSGRRHVGAAHLYRVAAAREPRPQTINLSIPGLPGGADITVSAAAQASATGARR
jgi:hypothetical protein